MTAFAATAPPAPLYTIRGRLTVWAETHRQSLYFVLPLLVIFGLIRFWNLAGALGAWNEDEGTYAAQAWAVLGGNLTHYTYWYDHPPFGWMQLAGWSWITNAFERSDSALLIGRELVAAYAIVSGGLIYLLCRRLSMQRLFGAVAMGLFMLSPLSLSWGKMGFLDNLTTPWVLAAMVVALSPHKSSSSAHMAGLLLAGAVLTKETAAVFVPIVFWMIWQNSHASMRVSNLVRSSTTLISIGLMTYILLAFLKGELFPGEGHVSLIGSLQWQLFDREGSGSIFDADAIAFQVAREWLRLDWFLLVAAALLLPVAAIRPGLRPIVLATVIHVGLAVRGGYLPIPFVVVFLPLAAIIVAGALDILWQQRAQQAMTVVWTRIVAFGVAIVFLVVAAPQWYDQASRTLSENDAAPLQSAISWLETNSPASAHNQIIGDDNVWPDLITRGYPQQEVDWFYKLDVDVDVMVRYTPPGGTDSDAWRSIDYIVIPDIGEAVIDSRPTLKAALTHATLVASFGAKPNPNYQIYRVNHDT